MQQLTQPQFSWNKQNNKQHVEAPPKSQVANMQIVVGDYKQENTTFQMETSFLFDKDTLQNLSKQIQTDISQTEDVFNNKVVIKLELLDKGKKKEVESMIKKLVELAHVTKKASLFSLLNINITVCESRNDNQIYLIANFVDDIHLMIEDVRKMFCISKESVSDSFLHFQLLTNNDITDFENESNSSFYNLMHSTLLKLKMKMDSQHNHQLLNLLGLGEEEGVKIIFSKIRNANFNLKFKSFNDIPNKSEFMNWIFQLQKARYTNEEIQILQQFVSHISDEMFFYSIFKESTTTIQIKSCLKGLFKYIKERKIDI